MLLVDIMILRRIEIIAAPDFFETPYFLYAQIRFLFAPRQPGR